ncbi:hypothetical protein BDY17DRAFT_291722 [Neohortaea acidophila]|uniref:SnoaL-like domain-containing protein n=1 Tax=Neohortaea acidophila TaxID=245834 RepID=A0A6A6Q2N2_9PEZI|nr:uncharacterized protein BDY17DRAFT_291722 [Neohortaea acidophila]KAF2486575.1 hypothetical protein BDY17DRAFT_291722 [Neohortaea acidophila]
MSQYTASVPPDGQVRPEIVEYFERFYAVSDTPDAHDKYAQLFTKDAKLIMGPAESNGRAEILKFRHGMWEKVAKRSHRPLQVYAFGAGADDVMLHGDVDFVLKDDRKVSMSWGAKAHFAKEDGELKMDVYQVFLDTGAMARAK